MILVTTGTNGSPFDRLLREIGNIKVDEEIVVQHGPSALRPANATCVEYVRFPELVRLVRESRLVISHGGVGSILVATINGKHPLVVPRLARYGEVVDDHQHDLARRLERAQAVTLVEDPRRLPEIVQTAAHGSVVESNQAAGALVDDLRQYLFSSLGRDARSSVGGS
jgi:UDP-N-acetylglucosamine transferase subunit ALG13